MDDEEQKDRLFRAIARLREARRFVSADHGWLYDEAAETAQRIDSFLEECEGIE